MSTPRIFFLFTLLPILVVLAGGADSCEEPCIPDPNPTVSYRLDIVRILEDHGCIYWCHYDGKASGGINLSSYEDTMASPGAVVPCHPESSLLYTALLPGGAMEDNAADMTSNEVGLIWAWIKEGASDL